MAMLQDRCDFFNTMLLPLKDTIYLKSAWTGTFAATAIVDYRVQIAYKGKHLEICLEDLFHYLTGSPKQFLACLMILAHLPDSYFTTSQLVACREAIFNSLQSVPARFLLSYLTHRRTRYPEIRLPGRFFFLICELSKNNEEFSVLKRLRLLSYCYPKTIFRLHMIFFLSYLTSY